MRKVILHVGLHKTASTFLQEKVWPKLQTYTLLTRPYTQQNHAFNRTQYADDTLYDPSILRTELDRVGAAGNLLVSDESLSGKPLFFSYVNRTLIADRLKMAFPTADVILFIRDQRDILLSHYSSYVTMPYGVKPIDRLFWKPGHDFTFADYRKRGNRYDAATLYYNTNDYFIHLDSFRYSPLVELYARVFGNVHVFLYEDLLSDGGAVLRRLEQILGEDVPLVDGVLGERINRSPSTKELERRRNDNICATLTDSRTLRALLRLAGPIVRRAARESSPAEWLESFVGDYYTQDNQLLRQKLPQLNWSGHHDKYR